MKLVARPPLRQAPRAGPAWLPGEHPWPRAMPQPCPSALSLPALHSESQSKHATFAEPVPKAPPIFILPLRHPRPRKGSAAACSQPAGRRAAAPRELPQKLAMLVAARLRHAAGTATHFEWALAILAASRERLRSAPSLVFLETKTRLIAASIVLCSWRYVWKNTL